MPTAYLALGYSAKDQLQPVVTVIRRELEAAGIGLFVFIERYQFGPGEAQSMMREAFANIRDCELLVAEVSEKAIGVGIEIGYAAALGKPVIYLRQVRAEHSTTAAGSADHTIIYRDTNELAAKLAEALHALRQKIFAPYR